MISLMPFFLKAMRIWGVIAKTNIYLMMIHSMPTFASEY
jgi:hypothetical protein